MATTSTLTEKKDFPRLVENLTHFMRQDPQTHIKIFTALIDTMKERYKPKLVDNVRLVLKAALQVAGDTRTVEEVEAEAVDYDDVVCLQARIYCMFGPDFGFLPRSATDQPGHFYIDDRCGRTLFGKRSIYAEVARLVKLAKSKGLDPNKMPPLPSFHNCGIW
jgi:hypothetical protein